MKKTGKKKGDMIDKYVGGTPFLLTGGQGRIFSKGFLFELRPR